MCRPREDFVMVVSSNNVRELWKKLFVEAQRQLVRCEADERRRDVLLKKLERRMRNE